ncbi:hypothetical protein RHMOL_Rhmol11G0011000 [Rhododendron molle]|uniref:Uncharacterized protein n=1 Tax=Rhododendron molle TaxID=49168 RepID=A0ACC0LMP7_RHOML|nr:hypothetical protein RHMOL_Rhmol11G0011000 [Rhododendron molle]
MFPILCSFYGFFGALPQMENFMYGEEETGDEKVANETSPILSLTLCLSQSHSVTLNVRIGLDLVYGGGSIGLMGLVFKAVHLGGGHVLGETVGEVKAVADMHERKAEMARHSDCFIALPGGYGTLEELLEVITWAQLGIHDKPGPRHSRVLSMYGVQHGGNLDEIRKILDHSIAVDNIHETMAVEVEC